MIRTLTAQDIADALGCQATYIYKLESRGEFPPPILPTLPKRMWRWGEPLVERVINGEWTPKGGA